MLSHLLLENPQCKQRVLSIPLELTALASSGPQLLMPRCLTNLSDALSPQGTSHLFGNPSILSISKLATFIGTK